MYCLVILTQTTPTKRTYIQCTYSDPQEDTTTHTHTQRYERISRLFKIPSQVILDRHTHTHRTTSIYSLQHEMTVLTAAVYNIPIR